MLQDLLLPRVLKSLKPRSRKIPQCLSQHRPNTNPPTQGKEGAEEELLMPWDDLTSSAKTGRKMIIVAVLLANSVNKAMTTVMRMTATGGGTPSRGCRRPPIHTDKPDSCRRDRKKWSHPPAGELVLS